MSLKMPESRVEVEFMPESRGKVIMFNTVCQMGFGPALDTIVRAELAERLRNVAFRPLRASYRILWMQLGFKIFHLPCFSYIYQDIFVVHGWLHRPHLLCSYDEYIRTRIRFASIALGTVTFVLYEPNGNEDYPLTHVLLNAHPETMGAEYAAVKSRLKQLPAFILREIKGLGPEANTSRFLARAYQIFIRERTAAAGDADVPAQDG